MIRFAIAAALTIGITLARGQSPDGSHLDPTHHVPTDKGLTHTWDSTLYTDGQKTYQGAALQTIGMPCGGIASGQLYVRGDGTLAGWWIANNAYNTGYGATQTSTFHTALGPWKDCYQTFRPFSYIEQGFTLRIGKDAPRPLDHTGFDDIRFTGEYPVATIDYGDKEHPSPVKTRLRVFSPFIPLDARASATPATVMDYTFTNTTKEPQTLTITGFLQNPVGLDAKATHSGVSRNRTVGDAGLRGVVMDLTRTTLPEHHPWNGNVALTVLSDHAIAEADSGSARTLAEKPLGTPLVGAVAAKLTLRPGETRKLTFLLTWFFPHRPHYIDTSFSSPLPTAGPEVGNAYANWFKSAVDVAEYLKNNLGGLRAQTFAFHDTYYHNTTLPYWLNRRLLMPVSTLATETCQWWATGKFYAWEGVGSCTGTCTHVWNYEQALAHFFPELERNIRERTDFSTSFQPDGGILTRDGGDGVHIDGQCGTVLKAYREHLQSKDDAFLIRNWPRIKAAMRYLIRADANADGLLEGVQPNTYDIEFFGANTYVGSLYLAALRAAGEMAERMREPRFADSCRLIAARGKASTAARLYNGEYFIQDVDLKAHPQSQYGHGCLADQLFGQTWADLYGLGNLYKDDEVAGTLRSIWRYDWAPDVAAQNKYHPAERDYADPGEAGLLVCTWPHDPHPGDNGVRYRDEVWTGIEYQVATDMIAHGMTQEALSMIKSVDNRYDGTRHNPFNEIECGDHYARAMASWGALLALEGFRYDGPAGRLGFTPRLMRDHFQSFFTGAEGWGTLGQRCTKHAQTDTISVVWGTLRLRTIDLEVLGGPTGATIHAVGKSIPVTVEQNGSGLTLHFPAVVLHAGETLTVNTRL